MSATGVARSQQETSEMSSDTSFTAIETADLRAFAGAMIPASASYKMPGADDEMIFADVVKSISREFASLPPTWRTFRPNSTAFSS